MGKLMLLCCISILGSCDSTAPQVILIRNGQMETSAVQKYGEYCWVAWYKGIEHLILQRDGTAHDPPFNYKWEPLRLSERDAVQGFFDRNNCKEPLQ